MTATSTNSASVTQTPSPLTPPSIASTTEVSEPWDQQPGEPNLWYDRFVVYKALAKPRYVETCYRQCQLKEKQLKKPTAPTRWHEVAREWNWNDRARAWDAKQHQELSEVEEDRRVEAREKRRRLVHRVLEDIAEGIRIADIPNMDEKTARRFLPDLLRAFKTMVEASRLEMGEPTTITTGSSQTEVNLRADDFVAAMRELQDQGFPVVNLNLTATTDAPIGAPTTTGDEDAN